MLQFGYNLLVRRCIVLAEAKNLPLVYKGHPLRRKDNILYYGSMADKYIIMLQIHDTEQMDDLNLATKVSVQLQLTDPDLKSRDRVVHDIWDNCRFTAV